MIGKNNSIKTYRITTDLNLKEIYSSTPTLNGLSVYLEPIELEPSEGFHGEAVYNRFVCFADGNQDIKISDKVIDSEGNVYIVNGTQYFKGGDIPSHTEISLTKKRSDYI
jgi:hypothetical protein